MWSTILYVDLSLYFSFYYLDIFVFQSVKRGKMKIALNIIVPVLNESWGFFVFEYISYQFNTILTRASETVWQVPRNPKALVGKRESEWKYMLDVSFCFLSVRNGLGSKHRFSLACTDSSSTWWPNACSHVLSGIPQSLPEKCHSHSGFCEVARSDKPFFSHIPLVSMGEHPVRMT